MNKYSNTFQSLARGRFKLEEEEEEEVIQLGYTSAVYLYLRSILTAGAVGVVFTDLVLSLSHFGGLISERFRVSVLYK